jgi:hypothetical protein
MIPNSTQPSDVSSGKGRPAVYDATRRLSSLHGPVRQIAELSAQNTAGMPRTVTAESSDGDLGSSEATIDATMIALHGDAITLTCSC